MGSEAGPLGLSPSLLYLFCVTVVLPFPEWHTNGLVLNAAFSVWLLGLGIMHLRLTHVVASFCSYFFFVAEKYSTGQCSTIGFSDS